MKRILSVALTLLLVLGLAACGGEEENLIANDEIEVSSQSEASSSDEGEVSSQTETISSNTEVAVSNEDETEKSDETWREFLADYEAWVDDYIAIYKKYQNNPTDMSILADYTKLAGETATWAEKADEVEMSVGAEDLAEYTATLSRIVGKLSSALY